MNSLMNYDVNRNNAEIIVSIDVPNHHNFRKDTEAQMTFGPNEVKISNYHFVCGSQNKNQLVDVSSVKDLEQAWLKSRRCLCRITVERC